MTKLQKWIVGLTGVLLIGMIGFILWYVSQTTLTTQLNTLFSVLLTVFSVLLSLIISQYYFDSSRQQTISDIKGDYQKNNKLYSQKAAEKVDNLSNELSKLSIYLQQSIDDDSDENPATTLLVREEKIRSAIHIVETLKSINDKSLSDWLGVLDEDDIEEQNEIREEIREERENDFRTILDNYRNVIVHGDMSTTNIADNEPLENVHADIDQLNKKIDKLATSIIGTPIKIAASSIPKQNVENVCPYCGESLTYKQRPTEASRKKITCTTCGHKVISKWTVNNGFEVTLRSKGEVGPTPPKVLSDEQIEHIRKALPKQPWPKGVSHDVAHNLGVSVSDVGRAIETLIDKGVFKMQREGVLYEPINEEEHN